MKSSTFLLGLCLLWAGVVKHYTAVLAYWDPRGLAHLHQKLIDCSYIHILEIGKFCLFVDDNYKFVFCWRLFHKVRNQIWIWFVWVRWNSPGSNKSLSQLFDNSKFWHWKLISNLLALHNSYYCFWQQKLLYFNLLLMTEIFRVETVGQNVPSL